MAHTHFAPAERATTQVLEEMIDLVAKNPVIDEILKVTSGLVAVLNKERQILAVNHSFLDIMEVKETDEFLGLRPGEFVNCVHAHEEAGGCGTSEYCKTCGAAIAIVAAIADMKPLDRMCAIKVRKGNHFIDMFFNVRCTVIYVEGKKLFLLFLQDITKQQEWANLEKVFYHDINNIIYALLGRSELLVLDAKEDHMRQHAKEIFFLNQRLLKEIDIQRSLSQNELRAYQPFYQQTTTRQIISDMEAFFKEHTAARNKKLILPETLPDVHFSTDISLLTRILSNMILNAFEASSPDEEVKIFFDQDETSITFSVWNRLEIPADIAKRVFQRNFTTKNDLGRGLGTYSMKFFGEEILDGKMEFSSSKEEGTIFRFSLFI